jgi:hypothetical protein
MRLCVSCRACTLLVRAIHPRSASLPRGVHRVLFVLQCSNIDRINTLVGGVIAAEYECCHPTTLARKPYKAPTSAAASTTAPCAEVADSTRYSTHMCPAQLIIPVYIGKQTPREPRPLWGQANAAAALPAGDPLEGFDDTAHTRFTLPYHYNALRQGHHTQHGTSTPCDTASRLQGWPCSAESPGNPVR